MVVFRSKCQRCGNHPHSLDIWVRGSRRGCWPFQFHSACTHRDTARARQGSPNDWYDPCRHCVGSMIGLIVLRIVLFSRGELAGHVERCGRSTVVRQPTLQRLQCRVAAHMWPHDHVRLVAGGHGVRFYDSAKLTRYHTPHYFHAACDVATQILHFG